MTFWDFLTVVFLFWWMKRYFLPWAAKVVDAPRERAKGERG